MSSTDYRRLLWQRSILGSRPTRKHACPEISSDSECSLTANDICALVEAEVRIALARAEAERDSEWSRYFGSRTARRCTDVAPTSDDIAMPVSGTKEALSEIHRQISVLVARVEALEKALAV
jgi:hypothetical protein